MPLRRRMILLRSDHANARCKSRFLIPRWKRERFLSFSRDTPPRERREIRAHVLEARRAAFVGRVFPSLVQSANANRYDFASKSAFLSRSDGDNGRRNAQTVDGYGNARFASIRGRAPLFLLFAFRALSIPRIGRDPLFSVFEIRSTFPARSHVRNRAPRSERRPRLPLQQCIVHSRSLARARARTRSKIARYAHISPAGRCGIDVSRYRWRRSRTRSRIYEGVRRSVSSRCVLPCVARDGTSTA